MASGSDLTFGTPAVDVVEVVEALQRSLDLGGAAVTLEPARPRIFRCFSLSLEELSCPLRGWEVNDLAIRVVEGEISRRSDSLNSPPLYKTRQMDYELSTPIRVLGKISGKACGMPPFP